jgi:hypothetical protein
MKTILPHHVVMTYTEGRKSELYNKDKIDLLDSVVCVQILFSDWK